MMNRVPCLTAVAGFSCASSSAIRAGKPAIVAACPTTNAANSSYAGCDGVDTTTI